MDGVKNVGARATRRTARRAALAVCALLAGGYAHCSLAEPSNPPTFESAEEASHALFLAAQKDDEREVANILGATTELVRSDDELEDQHDRQQFAQKYQEMHRLVREAHGNLLLYIGAENWPFPMPLVSRNGAWHFDSDAGGQEITYRRIGENEVTAIALCHELLADTHSNGNPVPLHGYYFRILSAPGHGRAAVAYPVVYRSSGVMTFIIDQNDRVREKDLGPDTGRRARALAAYATERGWVAAETP